MYNYGKYKKYFSALAAGVLGVFALFCLFILGISVNQTVLDKNLEVFSAQLFSVPLPQNTVALQHFRVVGSTSGMGNNRIYCAVLMLESTKGKEKLQQYYASTQFNVAQNKGLFDNTLSSPTIAVFPTTEWTTLRKKFENIQKDSIFLKWELQKENISGYFVVLTDGPYHSFVGENPRFQTQDFF